MKNPRRIFRVSLAALWLFSVAACSNQVELMASMPETEANEVIAALQKAGIKTQKVPGKEGNVGLTLEASQVGPAVDLLQSKGLPRGRFAGMGDVFKKEGLISSPLEERARYLYALTQELSATLNQIDGVLVARVHVVLPERSQPGNPNLPSSAAVFIKHQPGIVLDTVLPQIRKLVVNSIPGLTAEKVSIVLVSGVSPSTQTPEYKGLKADNSSAGFSLSLVLGLVCALALSLGGVGYLGWRLWCLRRSTEATVETI